MSAQLGLDFEGVVAGLLAHKWYGNTCPVCRARPGELCKQARGGFGRRSDDDDYGDVVTIHGARSRFERPGQCLGVKCKDKRDCWGCEP